MVGKVEKKSLKLIVILLNGQVTTLIELLNNTIVPFFEDMKLEIEKRLVSNHVQ